MCIGNGMFDKIGNDWHAINIGLLKLMHFNDLHPFVDSFPFYCTALQG